MSRSYVIAGAAVLAMAGTALAQSTNTSSTNSTNDSQTSAMSNGMNMRQQIQSDLSKDGFTNVTVTPSSFFVHATNKKGQAVAMVISPDSVTEVTDLGASGGSQPNGASGMNKANPPKQQ